MSKSFNAEVQNEKKRLRLSKSIEGTLPFSQELLRNKEQENCVTDGF